VSPHIVKLIAVCTEPGELSILMEYAERGTLNEVLDTHPPVPAWRRFQLLKGVVTGMKVLHNRIIGGVKRPIVHADLKGDNVLVSVDPTTGAWVAKIADFGLASGISTNTTSTVR
jgi:serine/threonine protein kinase